MLIGKVCFFLFFFLSPFAPSFFLFFFLLFFLFPFAPSLYHPSLSFFLFSSFFFFLLLFFFLSSFCLPSFSQWLTDFCVHYSKLHQDLFRQECFQRGDCQRHQLVSDNLQGPSKRQASSNIGMAHGDIKGIALREMERVKQRLSCNKERREGQNCIFNNSSCSKNLECLNIPLDPVQVAQLQLP
jgi:hypothetical protein